MKTALVTGASSGIGKATAIELARRGYHVIAAGRSESRMHETTTQIAAERGTSEFLQLDLSSLEASANAARSIAARGRALDVLVNNAGVGGVRGLTADGFELHFGINHLGHFMLTHHLRPILPDGARIIAVSSQAHAHAKTIDWERVRSRTKLLNTFADYGVSKLANILFVRRLAQLEPTWRTYAVHPGLADTGIFPAVAKPFFRDRRSPDEAAQTAVWCATSRDLEDESGFYYARCSRRDPSEAAMRDALAAELWHRSEEWCGISHAPG